MKLCCAGYSCSILSAGAAALFCGDCICQRSLERADQLAKLRRRRNAGQGLSDRQYRRRRVSSPLPTGGRFSEENRG